MFLFLGGGAGFGWLWGMGVWWEWIPGGEGLVRGWGRLGGWGLEKGLCELEECLWGREEGLCGVGWDAWSMRCEASRPWGPKRNVFWEGDFGTGSVVGMGTLGVGAGDVESLGGTVLGVGMMAWEE